MENNQEVCPYCGGTEMVKGEQAGHATVRRCGSIFASRRNLIHLICRRCGTVVRSYVEDPEYFVE